MYSKKNIRYEIVRNKTVSKPKLVHQVECRETYDRVLKLSQELRTVVRILPATVRLQHVECQNANRRVRDEVVFVWDPS